MSQFIEFVRCDHCGSDLHLSLGSGDKFRGTDILAELGAGGEHLRVVVCLRCGFIFYSPRLNRLALSSLYGAGLGEGTFYALGKGGVRRPPPSPDDHALVQSRAGTSPSGANQKRKLLARATGLRLKHKRVLDVRCKAGAFLAEMRRMGAKPVGLEDEPFYLACCEALGVYARQFSLIDPAKTKLGNKMYDVIRLNNVLAHSPSPTTTLRHFAKHLNPGGLAFIEEPDILRKASGPFPVVAFHHWHPTQAATTALLAAEGFRVISVRFKGSVMWIVAQSGYEPVRSTADPPLRTWWHFTKWRIRNRVRSWIPN